MSRYAPNRRLAEAAANLVDEVKVDKLTPEELALGSHCTDQDAIDALNLLDDARRAEGLEWTEQEFDDLVELLGCLQALGLSHSDHAKLVAVLDPFADLRAEYVAAREAELADLYAPSPRSAKGHAA